MKKIIGVLCVVSLLISGCSKKEEIKLNDKYAVKEETEGLEVIQIEYGEAPILDVKEYLKKDTSEELLKNTTLKVYKEDEKQVIENTSKLEVGSYVIVIKHKETELRVPFDIKDTIAPEFVKFSETVTFEEGDNVDLNQIFNASDESKVEIKVEGKVDFNSAGEYKIIFIATDESNNSTKKECTIIVKEKQSNNEETITPPSNSDGNNQQQPPTPPANNNSSNDSSNNNPPQETPKPAPEPKKEYLPSFAQEVLTLVNEERAKVGASPLTWDPNLATASDIRAKEIVLSFSHTRPDGSDCFSAVNNDGYTMLGENIAAGQPSATIVMNGWMNSKGHRENILNPDFNVIGISCYLDESGIYRFHWVQMFGRK